MARELLMPKLIPTTSGPFHINFQVFTSIAMTKAECFLSRQLWHKRVDQEETSAWVQIYADRRAFECEKLYWVQVEPGFAAEYNKARWKGNQTLVCWLLGRKRPNIGWARWEATRRESAQKEVCCDGLLTFGVFRCDHLKISYDQGDEVQACAKGSLVTCSVWRRYRKKMRHMGFEYDGLVTLGWWGTRKVWLGYR